MERWGNRESTNIRYVIVDSGYKRKAQGSRAEKLNVDCRVLNVDLCYGSKQIDEAKIRAYNYKNSKRRRKHEIYNNYITG